MNSYLLVTIFYLVPIASMLYLLQYKVSFKMKYLLLGLFSSFSVLTFGHIILAATEIALPLVVFFSFFLAWASSCALLLVVNSRVNKTEQITFFKIG